jgi:hypothetical protein
MSKKLYIPLDVETFMHFLIMPKHFGVVVVYIIVIMTDVGF